MISIQCKHGIYRSLAFSECCVLDCLCLMSSFTILLSYYAALKFVLLFSCIIFLFFDFVLSLGQSYKRFSHNNNLLDVIWIVVLHSSSISFDQKKRLTQLKVKKQIFLQRLLFSSSSAADFCSNTDNKNVDNNNNNRESWWCWFKCILISNIVAIIMHNTVTSIWPKSWPLLSSSYQV